MRIRAVVAALALALALPAAACSAGGGVGGLFRQYEYEEDVYLSLTGTATVYVNSSVAALNALRGTSFDASPNAPVDLAGVRTYFSTPVTHVNGQVNTTRRTNRRFVHVKIDVDDIRRLSGAPTFAWSTYSFKRDGDLYVYRQVIGPAAGKAVANVGWNGREVVAFRLHLPSRIRYDNTGRPTGRGNILVWEQSLADRLRGTPIILDASMDPQSILYRTLWLFGWTFFAVTMTFILVIWWVVWRAPSIQPGRGAATLGQQ